MTTITSQQLRESVERDFAADLIDAVITPSSVPGVNFDKLHLAQIAKVYSVPMETMERLAKDIAQTMLKADLDEDDYRQAVGRMKEIEAIRDPGYRSWKLQNLAREYKRTPRQLTEIYNKALIADMQTKPMTIADFYNASQQSVDWLVQGWIPVGSTILLHGDGGCGKTLFSYQLLENLLHGTDWQGFKVTQPSRCLLIQSDEPPLVTGERLRRRGITDDDDLHVLPGWQADGMEKLEAFIKDVQPQFVMVDSNTAINRNTIISENDTEYARPILQFADLASRYNCTFLILHHSNANGESRGTRAIFNSVSEVWGLGIAADSSDTRTPDRVLRVQKTRLGRDTGRYRFSFSEDQSFEYLGEDRGDGQLEDNRSHEKRVLQWLIEAAPGDRFAPAEIAEAVSIAGSTVRRCLRELWAKGLINANLESGGRYNLYSAKSLGIVEPEDRSPERSLVRSLVQNDDIPENREKSASTQRTSDRSQTENSNESVTKAPILTDRSPERSLVRSLVQNDSTADDAEILGSNNCTSDRRSEKTEKISTLKNPPIADRRSLGQMNQGDTVIPLGTAHWIKSGSDRLPAQYLPRSLKESKEIPLEKMTTELFHQLMTPSKVLGTKTVLKDNHEETWVKVRAIDSGRTSVFRDTDLALLSRGDES